MALPYRQRAMVKTSSNIFELTENEQEYEDKAKLLNLTIDRAV